MRGVILLKEEGYALQGAIFEVYREMGCGFLEAVYEECLDREMTARGIPFVAQKPLRLAYKGVPLTSTFRADFVCFDRVILEIKAVRGIVSEHRAQILNYLALTEMPVGLLVNFGHRPGVEIERFVL